MHGVPEYVLVRGRICAENGELRVAEGFGRFIPTPLRPPFVYDSIEGKLEEGEEVAKDEQVPLNGSVTKKLAELDVHVAEIEPPSAMFSGNPTPSVAASGVGRVDGKRDMQETSFSLSGAL